MVPWPLRIIQKTPLTELWNDHGLVPATPARDLTADDIASLLRDGTASFMVASVGEKPRWIAPEQTIAFWKTEVKSRLLGNSVYNDQIPSGGGYWAQEWRRADDALSIVVLTSVK